MLIIAWDMYRNTGKPWERKKKKKKVENVYGFNLEEYNLTLQT